MKRRSSHTPFRTFAALLTAYGWLSTSGFASESTPAASYFRTIQTSLLNMWCPPGPDRSLLSLQLESPGPAPFFTLPAEVSIHFIARKSGGYRCEIRCAPSRE